MQQQSQYTAYKNTSVQTADQRTLILMLYDGLLRFLQKSIVKMEAREIEAAHNYLVRSREIVAELLATLRPEKAGEIGNNLKRLYVYAFNRIIPQAGAALAAERALVETLGGGCQTPVGALASPLPGEMLELTAVVVALDGSRAVRAQARGSWKEAAALGARAGADLLRDGAGEILAEAQRASSTND